MVVAFSREGSSKDRNSGGHILEAGGIELTSNSSGKTLNSQSRGTESGTLCKSSQLIADRGGELQNIVDAWPTLPPSLRARILGMVEGAAAAREEA
jgi:hypothetical protein